MADRSVFALSSIIGSLPSFAIAIIGIVFAVTRWNRHPQVSMMVVIGLGIQMVVRLASMVLPMMAREAGGLGSLSLVFGALSLVGAGGSALIIAAVFSERGTTVAPPPQNRW